MAAPLTNLSVQPELPPAQVWLRLALHALL
jgi:hypothetical protein